VWLALAAKTVGGKILGIILPITAFVAAGEVPPSRTAASPRK